MTLSDDHVVGLRELRHNTREVLDRVQRGETVDVTDYGRLIARIVPTGDSERPAVLAQLIETGELQPATRASFVPRMLVGNGTDRLGDTLAVIRDEQRW